MSHEFDPRRILVVDDDPAMLRTHGRVLEAHGLTPVLIADPVEGVEEVRRLMPAVLVTELIMEGLSGLEMVCRVRGEFGLAAPPIILVSSAYNELSPMEELLFEVLLPKPYSVDTFVTHVRRQALSHYERRRAPSSVLPRNKRHKRDEGEENG
jgi:two-component system response regulator VicR